MKRTTLGALAALCFSAAAISVVAAVVTSGDTLRQKVITKCTDERYAGDLARTNYALFRVVKAWDEAGRSDDHLFYIGYTLGERVEPQKVGRRFIRNLLERTERECRGMVEHADEEGVAKLAQSLGVTK